MAKANCLLFPHLWLFLAVDSAVFHGDCHDPAAFHPYPEPRRKRRSLPALRAILERCASGTCAPGSAPHGSYLGGGGAAAALERCGSGGLLCGLWLLLGKPAIYLSCAHAAPRGAGCLRSQGVAPAGIVVSVFQLPSHPSSGGLDSVDLPSGNCS